MNREDKIQQFGLERCEFGDECDFCKDPSGGSWCKLATSESGTETEYYVCGTCLDNPGIVAGEHDKSSFEYVEWRHGITRELDERVPPDIDVQTLRRQYDLSKYRLLGRFLPWVCVTFRRLYGRCRG